MNIKTKQGGFTLIELMITVAIIALLAAVALPSYQTQIQKSRRTDVMESLLDCAAAQARHFTSEAPSTYLDTAGAVTQGICNPTAGALRSKDGFYNLTIANEITPGGAACVDAVSATSWCFIITATPLAGTSQVSDTQCATWTINQQGQKTAVDVDDNDTTQACWKS